MKDVSPVVQRVNNTLHWINHYPQDFGSTCLMDSAIHKAPVVQRLDSAVLQMKHYLLDNYFQNPLGFPGDSAIDPTGARSSSLGIAHL